MTARVRSTNLARPKPDPGGRRERPTGIDKRPVEQIEKLLLILHLTHLLNASEVFRAGIDQHGFPFRLQQRCLHLQHKSPDKPAEWTSTRIHILY